jgi:histidine ammonia-lyase
MTAEVAVTGDPLTAAEVVAVAHRQAEAVVGPGVAGRMEGARRVVSDALAGDRVVYGVTTGFGALATTRVEANMSAEMQTALLRSHAAGVGDPLPPEMVRSMLLLRARTLAQGHSGVRPIIVERLLELLRRDLLPVVPDRGSVGASGDLAPFAHLALPVIGEGQLSDAGVVAPAAEVLARHGLDPIVLEPKEGLSLLNGTEGMLSFGVLASARSHRLLDAADLACALSIEALLGSIRPFDEQIHLLRPHPGQLHSARRIRDALAGSGIVASHRDDFVHAVQDAYSLRCAPQVHGASRDVVAYADSVFARELGAVVDNPIVFPETDEVVSGGNFHGQPLAFSLDFIAIAMSEIASISERRTDRLLDPDRSSGLPPFLSTHPGLNSGYMITQYTAAALVAENRVLSHPASIDSVPTSGLQEDHVSMGWGAGRKLGTVLDNVTWVVAIEMMCAAEGIRHRSPLKPGAVTAAAVDLIRDGVAPLDRDRSPGGDIESVAALIDSGAFADLV